MKRALCEATVTRRQCRQLTGRPLTVMMPSLNLPSDLAWRMSASMISTKYWNSSAWSPICAQDS